MYRSRFKCSYCGSRTDGKLCTIYVAWFNADGARSSWKLRLCAMHTKELVGNLVAKLRELSDEMFRCLLCGSSSAEDLDPIWLTCYAPKSESLCFDLSTCAPCAAQFRIPVTTYGEKLPDRRSNSSKPEADDAWAWLGSEKLGWP